jgi:hypothetical protein
MTAIINTLNEQFIDNVEFALDNTNVTDSFMIEELAALCVIKD